MIADDVGRTLDDDVRAGVHPVGRRALVAMSEGSWEGEALVEVEEGGTLTGACFGGPCASTWAATATLHRITVHDGGRALEYDEFDSLMEADGTWAATSDRDAGFDLDPPNFIVAGTLSLSVGALLDEGSTANGLSWRMETGAPATLDADSVWLDRTASVTLAFGTRYDDYSSMTTVEGEVDGRAAVYDYASTD